MNNQIQVLYNLFTFMQQLPPRTQGILQIQNYLADTNFHEILRRKRKM